MRGYFTSAGFCGQVEGKYMLFACEADYYDCLEADEEDAAS